MAGFGIMLFPLHQAASLSLFPVLQDAAKPSWDGQAQVVSGVRGGEEQKYNGWQSPLPQDHDQPHLEVFLLKVWKFLERSIFLP